MSSKMGDLDLFSRSHGPIFKMAEYNVNKISLKCIDIQHNYIIEVGNECIKIIDAIRSL